MNDKEKSMWRRNYDAARARAKRRVRLMSHYKTRCGCAACGYKDNPAALEFNHKDPKTKRTAIADLMTCTFRRILSELRKCEVLCANCHRIETARQRAEGLIAARTKTHPIWE